MELHLSWKQLLKMALSLQFVTPNEIVCLFAARHRDRCGMGLWVKWSIWAIWQWPSLVICCGIQQHQPCQFPIRMSWQWLDQKPTNTISLSDSDYFAANDLCLTSSFAIYKVYIRKMTYYHPWVHDSSSNIVEVWYLQGESNFFAWHVPFLNIHTPPCY